MGRGSTDTLGGGAMPKIHTVDAWDGKDGQVSGSRSGGCFGKGRPKRIDGCLAVKVLAGPFRVRTAVCLMPKIDF